MHLVYVREKFACTGLDLGRPRQDGNCSCMALCLARPPMLLHPPAAVRSVGRFLFMGYRIKRHVHIETLELLVCKQARR
jgi:hypothetical protein